MKDMQRRSVGPFDEETPLALIAVGLTVIAVAAVSLAVVAMATGSAMEPIITAPIRQ